MAEKIKKAGFITLIIGIILLTASLVLAFTVGTVAVPICFMSSLIVNTAGVMMIRYKGGEDSL